ncbi:hypothetical protein Bpfe_014286 [Biomphalaria pfeifferi]|uniref:Calcium signal-modulating cyclophilin ligand n=1 Tax=Biomphalaria pfeifferi TaxID=112525 RepID=A0AAD8BM29_BIOPF|nr:hypothetical protein Bpfe_014286 [Biomphalaria pfeifferi]
MATLAETQREARRRKILQNQEERINRLLGKSPEATTILKEEVNFPIQGSPQFVERHDSPDDVSTPSRHTSPYNLRSRHSKVSSPPTEDVEKVSEGLSDDAAKASDRESISIVQKDKASSPSGDPGIQANPDLKADNETKADDESKTEIANKSSSDLCLAFLRGLDAQSFELLKICTFFLLAFISRQLLKLGIGLLIIPSIFFPFIILEATIIYLCQVHLKYIPLTGSRGNLMSAALILCGLKQEVLESYHLIMTHINTALSDLGIYFFAFIVCYGLS